MVTLASYVSKLFFFLRRGFTLEEALREILREPPDSNVLTDEDSAEEDEGGMIDNLNRQQLSAHIEMKLHNTKIENEQVTQTDAVTQVEEVTEIEETFPAPRKFPKSDRLQSTTASWVVLIC